MRVALLLVVAACGSTAKHPSAPPPTARDELVRAIGNADALSKLMQGSLVNGGLWFDDEACAKEFPVGEIQADRFLAFAACLAKLPLRASTREDALFDVAVLTYEPGFEIEARVIKTEHGPKLTWIGFAARVEGDQAPTISAAALEAHRLGGDRNGPLGEADARALEKENADSESEYQSSLAKAPPRFRAQIQREHRGPAASFAWLRVCLDPDGSVTSVTPFEATSERAWAAFSAAARGWKFRPFTARERAVSVCAMVRPSIPADSTLTEHLPLPPPSTKSKRPVLVLTSGGPGMRRLEAQRTAGTTHMFPKDMVKLEIQRAGVVEVRSTFRFCVDESGAIESVLPLQISGFADYDRELLEGIRHWRYSPFLVDGQPVPVCSRISFVYRQTRGPIIIQNL